MSRPCRSPCSGHENRRRSEIRLAITHGVLPVMVYSSICTEVEHLFQEVIGTAETDENAHRFASQLVGGRAGIFERFPGHLQQQTLMRVDPPRLAGRNFEERGVEALDLLQESTASVVTRPAAIGTAIERRGCSSDRPALR